ncbi:MAG: hypothetical protein HGB12_15070 [Bacteroidetes bacterium]|nr:hypothetical protein [Bacteroidota bacterium]
MAITSGQREKERIRQRTQININDLTTCYYCKTTGLKENDNFCPNCSFPQKGSQAEMKNFIWNINNKQKLLVDQKKAINKARNILYILAGMNFVLGILLGLIINVNIQILIACIISGGIYFLLGLWSRKQPFPAILSGFFVYIVFIVINAIADPNTIYQSLFWKAIIISGFIYGYKGVKDSKKIETELESIKNAKDLNLEN